MNEPNSIISNAQVAILGLIAESPRHGYQIELDIQSRGMREWTEIGFSSIYHLLNKLEKAGWLEEKRSDHSSLPARKVYQLTPDGWTIFTHNILIRLRDPRPNSADFALALANLGSLPVVDVKGALSHHLDALKERLLRIKTKHALDQQQDPGFPWFVGALFEYSESMAVSEILFVERLLTQLDQTQERKNG